MSGEYCLVTDIAFPVYCRPADAQVAVSDRAQLFRVLSARAWKVPGIVIVVSPGGTRLHLALGYYPKAVSGELGAVLAYLPPPEGFQSPDWTPRANPVTASASAYYLCEDEWVERTPEELIPLPQLIEAVAFAVEHDTLPGTFEWYSSDGSRHEPAEEA